MATLLASPTINGKLPPSGSALTLTRRLLPAWPTVLGWSLALTLGLGVGFGLPELPMSARLALIVFGLAVIGWVFTAIDDTYIAVVAGLVITVGGQGDPTTFFATLGDPLIWLLLASFIIAAGVTASGLSARLTLAVVTRTRSVNQLFYGLTLVILATAFIIPATSGRAALMVPIFLMLSKTINQPRISRALALLFPTIILLSAVGSLIGAGAHLVTAEIVQHLTGETITFARWTLLGLPFALISCLLSTGVILQIFLTPQERAQPLIIRETALVTGADKKATPPSGPLSAKEWSMLITVLLLVLLWTTETLHGLNNTLVALLGALVVTWPTLGLVPFKQALKTVEWSMLLFMAATLKLGEALVESGAADWIIRSAFHSLEAASSQTSILLVIVVAIVSLLSHLLITSRTARSSVLVPLVILLGLSLGYNPVLLAFLSTAAAGFCLTLPVSAKPVAMFANLEVPAYSPADLLRLSSILLPVHLVLLLAFTYVVWPALGLDLRPHNPIVQPVSEQPSAEPALNGTLVAPVAESRPLAAPVAPVVENTPLAVPVVPAEQVAATPAPVGLMTENTPSLAPPVLVIGNMSSAGPVTLVVPGTVPAVADATGNEASKADDHSD